MKPSWSRRRCAVWCNVQSGQIDRGCYKTTNASPHCHCNSTQTDSFDFRPAARRLAAETGNSACDSGLTILRCAHSARSHLPATRRLTWKDGIHISTFLVLLLLCKDFLSRASHCAQKQIQRNTNAEPNVPNCHLGPPHSRRPTASR